MKRLLLVFLALSLKLLLANSGIIKRSDDLPAANSVDQKIGNITGMAVSLFFHVNNPEIESSCNDQTV